VVDPPRRPPDQIRSLLIAGADGLIPGHVERLGHICNRQQVALITLWWRLRPATAGLLGATVRFMRLPAHEDAVRAADYIGRDHRLVLSGLTVTTGTGTTASYGRADSTSDSSGRSVRRGRSPHVANR
jgi:hypothetical protein